MSIVGLTKRVEIGVLRRHDGQVCERGEAVKRRFCGPRRTRRVVNRKGRVSGSNATDGGIRGYGAEVKYRKHSYRDFRGGGSDLPCGRDPEKAEDDMEDRETVDLNLRLGRPTRYSLRLVEVCNAS
jgi:hypothetical protein